MGDARTSVTRPQPFGLDGEMSGNRIEDGHRLIQIGVAVDTAPDGSRLPAPELFCSLIGWDESELVWQDAAASVHGIARDAVLAAPRADEVDDALHAWLVQRISPVTDPGSKPIMVGYNVGAFDAPFVRAALPRSASLFQRRYGDLNPLLFAFGESLPHAGSPPSWRTWKKHLGRVGLKEARSAGRVEGAHDAGTDALAALSAWREAGRLLAGLHDDASRQRAADRAVRKESTQATRRSDHLTTGGRPDPEAAALSHAEVRTLLSDLLREAQAVTTRFGLDLDFDESDPDRAIREALDMMTRSHVALPRRFAEPVRRWAAAGRAPAKVAARRALAHALAVDLLTEAKDAITPDDVRYLESLLADGSDDALITEALSLAAHGLWTIPDRLVAAVRQWGADSDNRAVRHAAARAVPTPEQPHTPPHR